MLTLDRLSSTVPFLSIFCAVLKKIKERKQQQMPMVDNYCKMMAQLNIKETFLYYYIMTMAKYLWKCRVLLPFTVTSLFLATNFRVRLDVRFNGNIADDDQNE